MELRQLHYFIALYEEGSVTRAARRLNVVQPAISMQIGKLEEEFGHPLFQRLPKGMVPTSAGEEAYRSFAPILQELRSARDRITNFGERVAGHISVGVISSVANNALSECLESFCAKYPDVSVRVTGGYTIDFLDMLQVGQLDIAVVNQSRGRGTLPTTPIMREDLALVCAAARAPALTDPVSLKAISAMNLVIPSVRHGLRVIIDEVASEADVRLEPSLEFDELKTIEEFVQRTDFVTILPPIAVHRALRQGRLKSFAITPQITRDIVCVHSAKRGLSAAAELFIAELKESMTAAMQFREHHVSLGRDASAITSPDEVDHFS